nr:type II toxin-antitoxin system ParD family antitoxin [Caulobacter sp. S45]
MNISLPEAMKGFVDEQVASGHYGTSSEYVRDLIRTDQQMKTFRELILDGLRSPVEGPADPAFFEDLRERVRRRARGG